MTERTQINQTFQSNLPENFIVENPKFVDFLKQYYISQEFRGGPVDILTNLDVYKLIDYNFDAVEQLKRIISS